MESPKIVSFGEVLWDLFPEGAQFGGAPANFACHAAILGANVSMVSAVGIDRHGREALDILRDYGIDVSLMQTVSDAATGTVGVALDSAGKPTFTIHENSAWDRITWTDGIETRVREADAVYFGTLGQRSSVSRSTIRRGIQTARDAGVPSIVDFNLRSPFFDDELIRESIELVSILLVDGEIVHTITGNNSQPGGSEELEPAFWDVSKLNGKTVTLQIVDNATGGWGHINVDHIVQSDTKPKLPELARREKSFTVESRYLIIPIQNKGKSKGQIQVFVGDQEVRNYGLNIAASAETTDWYAFFTIDAYKGQMARVAASKVTEEVGTATAIELNLPGRTIKYDVKAQKLNEAPLKPIDGRISIQVLADRSLTEIVGNDGRVFISGKGPAKLDATNVSVKAIGGNAKLVTLETHDLKSIWKK